VQIPPVARLRPVSGQFHWPAYSHLAADCDNAFCSLIEHYVFASIGGGKFLDSFLRQGQIVDRFDPSQFRLSFLKNIVLRRTHASVLLVSDISSSR
jgi:hypothetical protein